jgi:hypothetical protein
MKNFSQTLFCALVVSIWAGSAGCIKNQSQQNNSNIYQPSGTQFESLLSIKEGIVHFKNQSALTQFTQIIADKGPTEFIKFCKAKRLVTFNDKFSALCEEVNRIEMLESANQAICSKLLADFSKFYIIENDKLAPNIGSGAGLYANELGIYVVGEQAYYENKSVLATCKVDKIESLKNYSATGVRTNDLSIGQWQTVKETRAAANTPTTTWSLTSTCNNGGAQKLRTDGKVGFRYAGIDNINGTIDDVIVVNVFAEVGNWRRVRNFGAWFGWSLINFEEIRYNVSVTEGYTNQFLSPKQFPPSPFPVGTTPVGAGFSSGQVLVDYVNIPVVFPGGLNPNPSQMSAAQQVSALYGSNASSQTITGSGSSKFNMTSPSQYGWGGNTFGCPGTVIVYPNF